MLSKSGSLGAAVIVPTLNFEFSIFESLALLKVDRSKVVPEFLQQVISSPQSKRYFHSITTGLAVKHLHLVDLRKMRLVLPPIQEQTAIAGLLSTWDKAIEKTERLVQAKKRSFLWLQEQLISSKNSAAKGWKEFHLGDVSEVIKKTPIDSVEGKTLLTVKLHCLGVESNTRVKPKLTSRGRPYYVRNAGEFVIGRQNFHNGGFGIVPDELDGYIASNAITSLVTDSDQLNPDFLFYYFSRPNYYRRIGHIMDGTGQKELSEKQLLRLKLHLPDIVMQKQISDVLNTVKHEINLLGRIASAYEKQKRGLMQKLLTGQWRVRVDKEVA